jgi:serine protease Do
MENHAFRFLLVLSIITAPLAAGAFVFGFEPSRYFSNFAPAYDGYVPPRDIGTIVDQTQASTVGVSCKAPGRRTSYGSGWALILPSKETRFKVGYGTSIITNHHVIDRCVLNPEAEVKIRKFAGKWSDAYIIRFDKKNDLALLGAKAKIPPLALSEWAPYPGYWSMAVGNADGYEGSVAIGTVLNLLRTEVLITNNVSSGNSGGPLVDNEGNVIGIVSWSSRNQQYNGAMSLDAMCVAIIECEGETFWDWD